VLAGPQSWRGERDAAAHVSDRVGDLPPSDKPCLMLSQLGACSALPSPNKRIPNQSHRPTLTAIQRLQTRRKLVILQAPWAQLPSSTNLVFSEMFLHKCFRVSHGEGLCRFLPPGSKRQCAQKLPLMLSPRCPLCFAGPGMTFHKEKATENVT